MLLVVAGLLSFEVASAAEDANDAPDSTEDVALDVSEPGAAADNGATFDVPVPTAPDQLWLVNTRQLPDCPCPRCDPGQFEVYRHQCDVGWQRSSREEFLASSDPQSVTTVYVHGNDTDAARARTGGQQLYARLVNSPCAGGPVRFVIWSWPSEHVVPRVRNDIQIKVCRTHAEALYLADFLDRLDPHAPVSLSGYSLGARVTTGALHLLGGGVLEGRQLQPREHPERAGIRTVLLAAAMPDDWLLPGKRHERAVSQVDRLVVMYNPVDPVLRFYPYLYGRGGPDALGYTGIQDVCRLGEDRQKVCEVNVSDAVHRGHGWRHYIDSPWVIRRLRHELFMHDKFDASADTARQDATRR